LLLPLHGSRITVRKGSLPQTSRAPLLTADDCGGATPLAPNLIAKIYMLGPSLLFLGSGLFSHSLPFGPSFECRKRSSFYLKSSGFDWRYSIVPPSRHVGRLISLSTEVIPVSWDQLSSPLFSERARDQPFLSGGPFFSSAGTLSRVV